jgi:hypothetical protein
MDSDGASATTKSTATETSVHAALVAITDEGKDANATDVNHASAHDDRIEIDNRLAERNDTRTLTIGTKIFVHGYGNAKIIKIDRDGYAAVRYDEDGSTWSRVHPDNITNAQHRTAGDIHAQPNVQ